MDFIVENNDNETQINTDIKMTPEQIKHLSITCNGDNYYGSYYDLLNETEPCIVFKNIIDFTYLHYLSLENVALETKYWVQFAANSKCLKELHLSGNLIEYDCFNFSEEALESLLKIPTLEKVTLTLLSFNFFPKGSPSENGNKIMQRQSNIKELNVGWWLNTDYMSGDYYAVSDEFSESFANNLGTFVNLEKLKIECVNTKYSEKELDNIINNCTKLKSISVEYYCTLENLIKLIQMPRMESINVYLNNKNSFNSSLLEECNFSKLKYFNVIFWVYPDYEDNYNEIFNILKTKCPNMESVFSNLPIINLKKHFIFQKMYHDDKDDDDYCDEYDDDDDEYNDDYEDVHKLSEK
jgi:hypothetical protein